MTTTAIKWTALILMIIDHIGGMIPGMPLWMRYLGRCAAPLFIFALVWGFHYTKSPKKYLLRLYLSGVGMGVIVLLLNLVFPRASTPMLANIFPTMLLIGTLICLKGRQWIDWILFAVAQYFCVLALTWLTVTLTSRGVVDGYVATVVANALFPSVIYTEGGIFFVVLGVLMDCWKEKPVCLTGGYLLCCFAAFLLSLDRENMPVVFDLLVRFSDYQWMMAGALLPMLLYNRRRGKENKRFFYLFYPGHLMLLHCIGWALERLGI